MNYDELFIKKHNPDARITKGVKHTSQNKHISKTNAEQPCMSEQLNSNMKKKGNRTVSSGACLNKELTWQWSSLGSVAPGLHMVSGSHLVVWLTW